MKAPEIFISAGDPSGEMHAARLIDRLEELAPGTRVAGIGGPAMLARGAELLSGLDRLAVMGFLEVAAHLPFFLRLMSEIRRRLRERPPELVILVDFPDFNLRVAAEAKKLGIPVLYYISPQVWAWRQGRKHRIARLVDRLAAVFPFEVEFYGDAVGRVEFVGHPLLETLELKLAREGFFHKYGLDQNRPLVGLMPGSRTQELERHLEIFLGAARIMRERDSGLQFALGLLPHTEAALSPFHRATIRELGVREVLGDSDALLAYSRAVLSKSGTTTLETALHGTPQVIGYRTSGLSYALARRLVKVDHIGMPNILSADPAIPELVQDELTPENLARLGLEVLDGSSALRARILAQCREVREMLRTDKPASLRVAEIALEMCGRGTVE